MPDLMSPRMLAGLDRYAASNEDSLLVADPHSGPRRAERAKQTQSTSQGLGPKGIGMLRVSPWLVLVCAGCVAGCRAEGAQTGRIEPTYDRTTGRLELLKYDADGDGAIDTWSYMNGTEVVRIEIDTNRNGTLDRWEYYDATGRIEKVGSSRAQNGTPDAWAYYAEDGSVTRLELSTRRDGTIDRIEYYEQGAMIRAEEDTSGDGRVDKWEVYEGMRLASVAFDTTQSGYPDRRLIYAADGSARVEELEAPVSRP